MSENEPLVDPTLAAYVRDGDVIRCPECNADVTESKGSQPLPEEVPAETTHGWACEPCELVLPARARGATAPYFIPPIVEMIATLQTVDSSTENRWIPVPKRQLQA